MGIYIDKNTDNMYARISGYGLFLVKGLNGISIDPSIASLNIYTNQKRKATYLSKSGKEVFLIKDTKLVPITGMLGSTASSLNIYINNFNGKTYAYDRTSAGVYYFYKIEGIKAIKIQGINSTSAGYFRVNNYNGEVFFYQGSNLYRIKDTKAELIYNNYNTMYTSNNGDVYVTTRDNRVMKIVYN